MKQIGTDDGPEDRVAEDVRRRKVAPVGFQGRLDVRDGLLGTGVSCQAKGEIRKARALYVIKPTATSM